MVGDVIEWQSYNLRYILVVEHISSFVRVRWQTLLFTKAMSPNQGMFNVISSGVFWQTVCCCCICSIESSFTSELQYRSVIWSNRLSLRLSEDWKCFLMKPWSGFQIHVYRQTWSCSWHYLFLWLKQEIKISLDVLYTWFMTAIDFWFESSICNNDVVGLILTWRGCWTIS